MIIITKYFGLIFRKVNTKMGIYDDDEVYLQVMNMTKEK